MNRVLSALLTSSLLLGGSVALADEAGKTQSDTTLPDGTKVTKKKHKDIKSDGTGEVKTEVKTDNPNTGTETTKRTKVNREKNDDGSVTTTSRSEAEVKTKK